MQALKAESPTDALWQFCKFPPPRPADIQEGTPCPSGGVNVKRSAISTAPKVLFADPSAAMAADGGEQAGYALDVVVVQHPDGRLCSSDWHVVFRGSTAVAGGITTWLNGAEVPAGTMRAPATGEPAVFEAVGAPDESQAAPSRRVPPDSSFQKLLASGALRSGRNELVYSLPSGGGRVLAFLYLWSSSTPVVVFDIDGTVTQADVVGHFGQAIGHPFLHAGICEFACRIHAQGYVLLYLSARPLSGPTGIERTRRFLFHVSRDPASGFGLPPGPVLTTPHTSTFSALMDELTHKSALFKQEALRKIATLYAPADAQDESADTGGEGAAEAAGVEAAAARGACATRGEGSAVHACASIPPRIAQSEVTGLFAGFGNRSKDATAYLAAGIDPRRIFIINDRSSIVRWSDRPSAAVNGNAAVNVNSVNVESVNVNGLNVNGESLNGSGEALAAPVATAAPLTAVNVNGGAGSMAAPVPACGAADCQAAPSDNIARGRPAAPSDNTVGGPDASPAGAWSSYGGLMDTVALEFPLRWGAARAQQAVSEMGAAAAERLRVAASAGAKKCDPCSCFLGMRL